MSLQHIRIFRSDYAPAKKLKVIDKFMSLLSHLGDKAGLWACLTVSYHFQNQAHSFITGSQMCLFTFVCQTMKSILKEPRPMMLDGEINVKDCKHIEFGNPSAHTFGSSFMYITTVYLLYKHHRVQLGFKHRLPVLLALINITFLGIYVIGFSRVYKGVHTYNQVISGLV